MELTFSFSSAVLAVTDAFMYIDNQLRKPKLRYRLTESSRECSVSTRTQRSTITRATALLALILIPSLGSAAIYKCTASDGSITYTDTPCPEDMTTQHIDPAAPSWLNESSQNSNTTAALLDANSQAQPEIMAILCANDEFKFWLKAQRHGLPERDARTAKFIRFSYLCRRALHLPDLAAPIPSMPLKRVLAQETP
jgi:Domain of unknown function (DUF4124)